MTKKPHDAALNCSTSIVENVEQQQIPEDLLKGQLENSLHVAQNAVAPSHDLPATLARESGGQAGLDPTRYGDWEKKGRCTDF
ncbi:MAG: hypothetical protein ACI9UN_001436 [Granulosicoccus sp.]|jgi:hypothetical protein